MIKHLLNTLFCIIICLATSWGQILSNTITGSNPGQTSPYSANQITTGGVTSTGISRSAVITPENGNDIYNTSNWNGNSIELTNYLEFTITPNAGFFINFNDFTYTGTVGTNGPINFELRSSVDNFGAAIGTANGTGTTIPLTASAYQNVTTAISFRLYAWNAQTPNGLFAINDFSFGGTALPVELTSFKAEKKSGSTVLYFSTATEVRNDYFSVERSADGTNFAAIGRVEGAGTTYAVQYYTYEDVSPLKGTNYYRLKQVDTDGAFAYSPVVSVVFGQTGTIRLSPMPATDNMRLLLDQPATELAVWEVTDPSGRLLLTGQVAAESTEANISVASLTSGVYIVRFIHGQSVEVKQFVKE